jgi:hypothetical protein
MGAAVYGHSTFFLLAQAHAGEGRAAAMPSPTMSSGVTLTAIMEERAVVTAQLAAVELHRCVRDCPGTRARRMTLAAKLDALNAEADDVRRINAEQDRIVAQRDALLADPVTSRIATLLSLPLARVDLISSLMFAAVLEGVACLLWSVSLRPPAAPAPVAAVTVPTPPSIAEASVVAAMTPLAVTPVTTGRDEAISRNGNATDRRGGVVDSRAPHNSTDAPLPESSPADDDVAILIRDVAAGRVRPTVADIRRHLGCSQARAAALRRHIVNLASTA